MAFIFIMLIVYFHILMHIRCTVICKTVMMNQYIIVFSFECNPTQQMYLNIIPTGISIWHVLQYPSTEIQPLSLSSLYCLSGEHVFEWHFLNQETIYLNNIACHKNVKYAYCCLLLTTIAEAVQIWLAFV